MNGCTFVLCTLILCGIATAESGLLEIKTGSEKLTAAELDFHARWPADTPIVRTVEEAQLIVIRLSEAAR